MNSANPNFTYEDPRKNRSWHFKKQEKEVGEFEVDEKTCFGILNIRKQTLEILTSMKNTCVGILKFRKTPFEILTSMKKRVLVS